MFRINNNLLSINARRQLGKTERDVRRTIERMASGLRINRAADDAAGMFVSENMRSRIAALKQANRNVAQAQALLQVMEGGLDRITSILIRLKELAIQAADGAYSDAQRNKGIQVEADELIAEINRITAAVNYNGITLFPDLSSVITFQAGEGVGDRMDLDLDPVNADQLLEAFATKVGFVKETTNVTGTAFSVNKDTGEITGTGTQFLVELSPGDLVQVSDGTDTLEYFVQSVTDNDTATLDFTLEGRVSVFNGSTTVIGKGTKFTKQLRTGDKFILNGTTYTISSVVSDTQITLSAAASETFTGKATAALNADFAGTSMKRATVAGQYTDIASIPDFLTQINTAIDSVVSVRARLGAFQNRLIATDDSLQLYIENLTNSESVIRDADLAEETSALVRAQILVQAGTTVLNQANLVPQNVLALLAGLG